MSWPNNPHTGFVRPKSNKAIPIVNPNSRETRFIHPSLPPRPPSQPHEQVNAAASKPPATSAQKHSSAENYSEDDLDDTNIERGFDVYAMPFVPSSFTAINSLPGKEINTVPTKRIDFGAYAGTSLQGILERFLPLIPQPSESPGPQLHAACVGRIEPQNYENFLRHCLDAEIQSQDRENKSYSLYGQDVSVSFRETREPVATCCFSVPGLRENSPYVEEDDPIQLRQLCYDRLGRLIQTQMQGPSSTHLTVTQQVHASPWTGMIYNGRVSAVLRSKELLIVNVYGLTAQRANVHYLNAYNQDAILKFNVQFLVPRERYLPMIHVLPVIQSALNKARRETLQDPNASGNSLSMASTVNGEHEAKELPQPRVNHYWLQQMLFPTEADSELQANLNPANFSRSFFDVEVNWEQKKAIESICTQDYGTLPYLISGPPGTGKTKTLIEAALQLVRNVDKVSHILLCAPSDPAADTLAQRLIGRLAQNELLRLNRPTRTFAEVPDTVLPYCHSTQGVFSLPDFQQLMAYKIVVTTCRDASLIMYGRMTNTDLCAVELGLRSVINPHGPQPSGITLHWTALLIDEAAQAIEPEALIPLSVVAPPLNTVKPFFTPLVVMAGDQHQLGPRTSLPTSLLKTSLFARLFARPVYAKHPLARDNTGKAPPPLRKSMLPILRPAFANLVRNYRSHLAILAVPSALFYTDTLEPEARDIHRLAGWKGWRGRRWPVLFHNNTGKDDLERDGGGWYNAREADIACAYTADLVQSGLVAENEICIMSPFKAQVARLRRTMRLLQYGARWGVNIGPCEAFQGLESGVVILCTTRSRERFVERDKELGWGVVGMPNKMNVALTRAKFGLIIVGRREVLEMDPDWKAVVEFCCRNGLVAGSNIDGSYPEGEAGIVGRTRLEKVLLAVGRDVEETRVLKGPAVDDEMWAGAM